MPNPTDTLFMPACPTAERVLGQYTLVREAGRGGMSVVYEAHDTQTGRTVAVKVLALPTGLPTMQTRERQARFAREAHAVVGLSHPNIVSISALGEHDGQQFLVMEFLHGETLRQRLVHEPLTPVQALSVLRQVADAVDAVHALGIVHRDIKPSNVMLMRDGTAKLLDFGIARQEDDATLTSAGMLVGSPAYMSPEQVRGEPATLASDLWALGALLYEMLAGRPPFTGGNIPSVLYQVLYENPPPVAGMPAGVQRVLRRALHKNPARRYPTGCAFAESLAGTLSPAYTRLPQHLHRRPGQWTALAAVALALVGLGVLALRLGQPRFGVLPVHDIVHAADLPRIQPGWKGKGMAVTGHGTLLKERRRRGISRHQTHRRHPDKPRHPAHRTRNAHRAVPQKQLFASRRIKPHTAATRRIAHRFPLTSHTQNRRAVARHLAQHFRPAHLSQPATAHSEHRVTVYRQRLPLSLSAGMPRRLGVVVWHSTASKPTESDAPRTRRSPDKPFDPAEAARLQKSVWPVGR